MDAILEHRFTCPYCWGSITMLLDLSAGAQDYVEDCEICCNPIQLRFEAGEDAITGFEAERMD